MEVAKFSMAIAALVPRETDAERLSNYSLRQNEGAREATHDHAWAADEAQNHFHLTFLFQCNRLGIFCRLNWVTDACGNFSDGCCNILPQARLSRHSTIVSPLHYQNHNYGYD